GTAVASRFAWHSRSAGQGGRNSKRPSPPHRDSLLVEWQLRAASADPLGIRCIAEDVDGVEKDHVIATAKSEPNKQSGQFSLSKPTAGFPPGKYRVEIWQSGKEIFREPFKIAR